MFRSPADNRFVLPIGPKTLLLLLAPSPLSFSSSLSLLLYIVSPLSISPYACREAIGLAEAVCSDQERAARTKTKNAVHKSHDAYIVFS